MYSFEIRERLTSFLSGSSVKHPRNTHYQSWQDPLQNFSPVSLVYTLRFLSQQRNHQSDQRNSARLFLVLIERCSLILAHLCPTPIWSRSASSPLTEYGLEQRISPFNQRASRVLRLASLAVHVRESFHKSATTRYRSTNQPSPLPSVSRVCN